MLRSAAQRIGGTVAGRRCGCACAAAAPSWVPTRQLSGAFVTPAARHLIDTNHLDSSAIVATGPGNRLLKGDVLAFMGVIPPRAAAPTAAAPAAPAVPPPTAAPPTAAAPATAPPELEPRGPYEDEKPSQMRRIIAERLTQSKADVPHYYVSMDIDISSLLVARKAITGQCIKCSVNDMIVKACALALQDMPQANAFFDEASGTVKEGSSVDVCVAVATDGGLITPIVKNANQLSLPAINSTVGDLATRARKGGLLPEEFQGGSFTISNLGMFGIDYFTAVINPPQSAILAVGKGEQKVVFPNGDDTAEPVVTTVMSVMMSADRRVLDEGAAARFLQIVKGYLETPILL